MLRDRSTVTASNARANEWDMAESCSRGGASFLILVVSLHQLNTTYIRKAIYNFGNTILLLPHLSQPHLEAANLFFVSRRGTSIHSLLTLRPFFSEFIAWCLYWGMLMSRVVAEAHLGFVNELTCVQCCLNSSGVWINTGHVLFVRHLSSLLYFLRYSQDAASDLFRK